MIVVTEEILINAELRKVYEIAETYPLFVGYYKKKKKICSNNNKVILYITSSIFGIPITWEGVGIMSPYNFIEYKQTKGLLKGMSSLWSFVEKDNKTIVKIANKIKIRLFILGALFEYVIGNFFVKGIIKKILFSLKNAAENDE